MMKHQQQLFLLCTILSTVSRLVCYSFTSSNTIPYQRLLSSHDGSDFHLLNLYSSFDNEDVDFDVDFVGHLHHTAIKTRNISTAIQFYNLLGFEVVAKFKAGGGAKAAWLEQRGNDNDDDNNPPRTSSTLSPNLSRIELIEVPSYLLNEPTGMKRRALDLFKHQEYLGMNHLALDVTRTSSISSNHDDLAIVTDDNNINNNSNNSNVDLPLHRYMQSLNEKSLKLFQKSLRVALEAEQFMVGNVVYERAFIYDADGSLIELLRKSTVLSQFINPMSGWNHYDGDWIS